MYPFAFNISTDTPVRSFPLDIIKNFIFLLRRLLI